MSPVAHPVGAGVPDGPHRRTFEYRRTLVYPSVGAGVPDGPFSVLRLRVAPASCMYASGGHISFNSERNMEKNAAKNRRFLDFPFVQLQLRRKKVPHRIACTPIPAAAPAYRAKTFFSRAVQGKCFTSYIILYSAARRAAPIYHSPPENATRSRVPRLNVPNGDTPPTLISPCLRSRTP